MCRALLYLGQPVLLDHFLFQPDSSLVKQSYLPKMLHLLELAGFGMRAWDASSHEPEKPFAYASDSIPVFDRNLKGLAEKIRARCVLAHVRGVPYNTKAEIATQNVHPFQFAGARYCVDFGCYPANPAGDTSAWVEVPEYSMLHTSLRRNGSPAITLRELD